MTPDISDKIRRFVQQALAAERAKIDQEYAVKMANAREELGVKGLAHSSVMNERITRLHSEQIAATVRAKADALLEAYELYGAPIDDAAYESIIEEVCIFHEMLVKARSGTARNEAAMHAVRTGSHDPGGAARAQKFGRDIDRFSTPILNEIACEIERKRYMQKKPEGQTNIRIEGQNARVNVNSTDNSTNIINNQHEHVFVKLRQVIQEGVPVSDERTEILQKLDDLEEAKDSSSFGHRYSAFIAAAANHMALLTPFLPSLGEHLKQLLG